MKKSYIFIFLLLTIFLLSCSKINEVVIGEEKKEGKETIVVGGIENNEPYSYLDKKGKKVGYNIDILNALFEELDYNVEYLTVTNEDFMEKLDKKEINLVVGIQYDEEYIKRLKYSKPIIKNEFNIFVKSSEKSIRSIEDLLGKKISIYKYDPAYQRFKNSDKYRVYLCESEKDAYDLLQAGAVDAFIANRNVAINYIEDSIIKGSLVIVGEKYLVYPSAIATLEENKYLINDINLEIDKLKGIGKLEEIQVKWFGEEVNKNNVLGRIVTAFVSFGLVLFIIILFIISINKMLKEEVEQRTNEITEEIKYKEAIMDSLFDYLITLDNNLNITTVNRRVKEMDIIQDKDVCNKNIKDTELIKLVYMEDIKNVYLSKEKVLNRERKIEGENDIYIDYNIMPVIVDSKMKGVAITLKDITEKKQMMRKITHKDKMESLGRLTAGIAHEIRNPLASIAMYLKILPDKINNPEYRKQITEDIPKEITRLNNLVKNLLEYSTPRLSQASTLNLKSEIEFVLRLLNNKIIDKNIAINVIIGDNINIEFDKDHFKQIIINTIINAIEALNNVSNPKIDIYCNKDVQGYLDLFISNNGDSISNSIAENIFEPFITTKAEGTGLGLSIVSQLCKENNSEIYLDKDNIEGVTFIIKIPSFEDLEEDKI